MFNPPSFLSKSTQSTSFFWLDTSYSTFEAASKPSQDCVTKMQMHIVFVFHFSSIVHRLSSIIARLGFECYLNGERGVGNERGERENEKWEENLN